jgi:transporter family-2 protein
MVGLLLAAAFVGVLLAIQAGVNAQLRTAIGDPIATALASFVVGSIGLLILTLALRAPVPLGAAWDRARWWQWTGGLLGATYIAVAVVLAPRLGAGTLIAAVVAGQMVASVILDHFGLVGFAVHPATGTRLLGTGLVILGVFLIKK